MHVAEAKDFLVQRAAEQAALDGLSLSELEKRIMHFTESEDATEDPVQLNDEFEAEYDTATYEAKMADLLHRAYQRVKKESPESTRRWNEAIQTLRRGDHYLLVLWDEGSDERPPYDSIKLFGTALLVAVIGLGVTYAFILISDHYGFHWNPAPSSHKGIPTWLQRSLIFLMAAAYLYYVVFVWILKRPPQFNLIASLLRMLFGSRHKSNLEK